MSEINPDFESQETAVLISTPNPTRDNWRRILVAVQACRILISSANKAKKSSVALAPGASSLLSTSYSVVSTCDTGEGATAVLISTPNPTRRDNWRRILLTVQACQVLISSANKAKKSSLAAGASSLSSTSFSVVSTCDTGEGDSKLTGTANISTTLPQVFRDVNSDGADDHNGSNRKRQYENIARIVKEKDLVSLHNFGGVRGIAEALNTDLESGIHGNEEDLCSWRIDITLSEAQAPTRRFFGFLFKSCNSYIIFLLLLSAILSLGLGIEKEGARTGWYEGVIIILAVIILVIFPSIRDCLHRHLQKPTKKRKMVVDVLRGGRQWQISISDVVLGDIVCLKRGHQVPADGLFIPGEFLELDDSLESIDDQNPFMFYGSKVINGNGRMLVTCVGMNTVWGEMMNRVNHTPRNTPLQAQLDKVSTRSQIIGLTISILILVVLFLRYKLGKEDDESGHPDFKGKPTTSKELMDAIKRMIMKPSGKISILTTSLTMLLVGIVEGLPFVVTLAVTYINKKTLCHKALAQDISDFVTMGLVTTICTCKTGGLTLNPLEVDLCYIGEELISEDSIIDPNVLDAFCIGISTPVLIQQCSCSSIDDTLLSWAALKFGMKRIEFLKQNCKIVQAKEQNSNDERSGVLMRKNGDNETNMRVHWKGPATTILATCSHYYNSEGTINPIDENKRKAFETNIKGMQSKHLDSIAFAYKQTNVLEENNLVLIGLVGLKHTCWREMRKAMEDCKNAGVSIKLVSEDNVSELKAIAEKCGILMPDSNAIVLEGEEFRNFSNEERMVMVDQIAVMGNSLPSDRLLLVKCLKQKGNIVAVVGDKTTDTPALKEAHVGIAMGTWSTKMARESSDIIILDGNFTFLATIVRCGSCAYDNIRKYIQLELTMTTAGLLINTITTVSLGDAPITAIQLAWSNLIVTVCGGWALLTDERRNKLQVSRTEPLITKAMWRNIGTQAFYQATILVTFLYKGQVVLNIDKEVSKSMIFNSYVLSQVFNQFSSRELENKNVFKGIHQNRWFWVAVGFTVVLQEVFIETAHILAGTARLNCEQWAVCSLIGMVSWVIDWVAKFASDFVKDQFNGSISSTLSDPLEFTSNLELPLINGGQSTEIPS